MVGKLPTKPVMHQFKFFMHLMILTVFFFIERLSMKYIGAFFTLSGICVLIFGLILTIQNYVHPGPDCLLCGAYLNITVMLILIAGSIFMVIKDIRYSRRRREIERRVAELHGDLEGLIFQNDQLNRLAQGLNVALLDTNHRPNSGLSTAELEQISLKPYALKSATDNLQETCTMCLENFKTMDLTMSFPICQHLFHQDCAKEWLKNHSQCPICRSDVRSNLLKC